jgi:plastocyanin
MRKTVIALMMALPMLAACPNNTPSTPNASPSANANPGSTTPVATPSGAPGSSTVAQGPAQADAKILYKDFNFSPAEVTIKVGQSVGFENPSTNVTNMRVVADTGVFDSPEIEPGKSFIQKFDKAGVYTFRHHLNSSARGTITVQ